MLYTFEQKYVQSVWSSIVLIAKKTGVLIAFFSKNGTHPFQSPIAEVLRKSCTLLFTSALISPRVAFCGGLTVIFLHNNTDQSERVLSDENFRTSHNKTVTFLTQLLCKKRQANVLKNHANSG